MACNGTAWGDCITDASLDALANDWEADILRISLYMQEGGYDTDPAGFTQMVSTIIDKVTARGMYAPVDWHHAYACSDPNANLAKAKHFSRLSPMRIRTRTISSTIFAMSPMALAGLLSGHTPMR